MSIKIGFYGMDAYDILHYLSRILKHLERQVLLVEQSEGRGLEYSVLAGTDFPGIYDYRGIDFTNQWKDIKAQKADYSLIMLGGNVEHLKECDLMYGVTDYQLHHLHQIARMQKEAGLSKEKPGSLIIRDFSQREQPHFVEPICAYEHLYYLPEDASSMRSCLDCQYDQIFKFTRISPELREFLWDLLLREFAKKEIKHAFRRAERGK